MTPCWEDYLEYLRRKSMERRFDDLIAANESISTESDPEGSSTKGEREEDEFVLRIRSPLFSPIDTQLLPLSQLCVEFVRRHEEENLDDIVSRDTIDVLRNFLHGQTVVHIFNNTTNDLVTEFESIPAASEPFTAHDAYSRSVVSNSIDVARFESEASEVFLNISSFSEPVIAEPPSFGPEYFRSLTEFTGGYQRVNPRESPLFSPLYSPLPELLVEYVKKRPDNILPEDFSDDFYENMAIIQGERPHPVPVESTQEFTRNTFSQAQIPQRLDTRINSCEQISRPVVSEDKPEMRISKSPSTYFEQHSEKIEMSTSTNGDKNSDMIRKASQDMNVTQVNLTHIPQVFQQLRSEHEDVGINSIDKEILKQFEGKTKPKSKKNRREQQTKRFYQRRFNEVNENVVSSNEEVTDCQAGKSDLDKDGYKKLKVGKRNLEGDSERPVKRKFKIFKLCSCERHVCRDNTD